MTLRPRSLDMAEQEQYGPLKIGERLRKYEILQLIGQGGYASVYRARDTFFQRDVAIKVLHRIGGVTEDMKRRGQAEASFLNRIRHPNIVEVFDADISESGLLYIVMELLVGRSLGDVLREHRRIAVEEAFAIAVQVAEAVEAAHQLGAIHRDLKPENIFITAGSKAKVLDFGIAKYVDDIVGRTTAKDALQGSVLYMSPEHVQGIRVGPQTDIYALGIILYRALAGEHPVLLDLEQPTTWAIAGWHVNTMPRPLAEVAPWVPRHASRFVSSACAKDVRDRPESMAAAAALAKTVLDRFLTETGGELRGQARDLSRPMQESDPQIAGTARMNPARKEVSLSRGAPDAAEAKPSPDHRSPLPAVATEPGTPPTDRVSAPNTASELPAAPDPSVASPTGRELEAASEATAAAAANQPSVSATRRQRHVLGKSQAMLLVSASLGALIIGGGTKAYLVRKRPTLDQAPIAASAEVPVAAQAAAAPPNLTPTPSAASVPDLASAAPSVAATPESPSVTSSVAATQASAGAPMPMPSAVTPKKSVARPRRVDPAVERRLREAEAELRQLERASKPQGAK